MCPRSTFSHKRKRKHGVIKEHSAYHKYHKEPLNVLSFSTITCHHLTEDHVSNEANNAPYQGTTMVGILLTLQR